MIANVLRIVRSVICPQTPSLFKTGTSVQRRALAIMIERGLRTDLREDLLAMGHPEHSQPLNFEFECLILGARANIIGYALMGLDLPFMDIWNAYRSELARKEAVHERLEYPAYIVAAEMLCLPIELLLEAQGLRHFGLSNEAVLEELRKGA